MATHAEAETVERAGAGTSVTLKALCCSNCDNVAATANEIFTEPTPFHEGYVWSYELDLLDVNTAVYSATPIVPGDEQRFDIVRINPEACGRLRLNGMLKTEETWFPPHGRMRHAMCRKCPQQLGWIFSDEHSDQPDKPDFAAGA